LSSPANEARYVLSNWLSFHMTSNIEYMKYIK
jgi:hypothetical protein